MDTFLSDLGIALLVLIPSAVLGFRAIDRLRSEIAALRADVADLEERLAERERAVGTLAEACAEIRRGHAGLRNAYDTVRSETAKLRTAYETGRREIAELRRMLDGAFEEIAELRRTAGRREAGRPVPPGSPGADPGDDPGTAGDRLDARVVLIEFYLSPAEPTVTDVTRPRAGAMAAAPDERFEIGIRRRVITQRSASPEAIRKTERACAEEPGKVREYVDDMLAGYAAGKIVDSTFDEVTEWWTTRDPLTLGRLADGVDGASEGLHELLLGEPVERVGDALGLPGPLADLAGGVASAASLPGDVVPREARMVLEVAGVCAGALLGAPVLSTACMKALAHDAVLRGLTEGIKAGLESVCERDVAEPVADRPYSIAGPASGRDAARVAELLSRADDSDPIGHRHGGIGRGFGFR